MWPLQKPLMEATQQLILKLNPHVKTEQKGFMVDLAEARDSRLLMLLHRYNRHAVKNDLNFKT